MLTTANAGSFACTSTLVTLIAALTPANAQGVFRSIDGTGNNVRHSDWGRAGALLLRKSAVSYGDGVSTPAGSSRPSARSVSNKVSAQSTSIPNRVSASSFVWQWGQFLDHDITLTETTADEYLSIAVPRGDPWFDPGDTGTVTITMRRSEYEKVGAQSVRQQINGITAYIDASNVYGSDVSRALALVDPDGTLKTSPGQLLPFNTGRLHNAPADTPNFFLAGDVRANEQIGLIAMHTLFVREHNRIVRDLRRDGFDAITAYQIARALVGAEMQAITYREFLPVLLGRGALRPYRGYRGDVDAGISNIFSTAAYRLGHSMLDSTLLRLDARGREIAAGHVALKDAFFAPQQVVQHGIDPVLRGLASQRAQQVDPYVVDDVRNFLFGRPGAGGFDLAALNIQRGRDHGLPGYNRARRDFGLTAARSFSDITPDRSLQAKLRSAYSSMDDVDVWVGGLAESHVRGAMVGPLFHRILVDQFERLRDGDRFWYESFLPRDLVRFVESRTLSVIIRDNTGIGSEISPNVFVVGRPRR